MNLLIKSATVIDFISEFNGKKTDILVEAGMIKKIAPSISVENVPVFTAKNLHVSIGWFDAQVNFNDPGLEHKEDLMSGCKAAAFGGFTAVACMPSTHTPSQSKSEIEYIINKTQAQLVDVFPIGALSQKLEGKEMTEMFDMHNAGAIAFSDNKKPVADAGLLSRALLYAKGFDGKIIHYAEDAQLASNGKMNEGDVSTLLGVKGIPALAEELMVGRDIALAEYNHASLHLASISTAKSVELVRSAKKKGIAITCGVALPNLILTDDSLMEFDSNYKVKPPLRIKLDQDALWDGLKDGTIDLICSDHSPQDIESKEKEFDHAAFGMISLELSFALMNTVNKKLSLLELIEKISTRPRAVFNLTFPELKVGARANLTLFNPELNWSFTEQHIQSKSKNTPFIGKELKGKVLAVVNKNQWINIE